LGGGGGAAGDVVSHDEMKLNAICIAAASDGC
jgi:hypothetical protein